MKGDRKWIWGIALLIAAAGILVFTGNTKQRTGHSFYFIHSNDSDFSEEAEQGLLSELKDAGLIRDKDYTMVICSAQGEMAMLNSIIDAAAAGNHDIIFVSGTPALQAAVKKIKKAAIVFTNSADPVAAGAGKSFTEHLPNVTGKSTLSDFDGMVTLVRQIKPSAKTIGTIYTPSEINSVIYKDALEKAAHNKGLTLVTVPVYATSEVLNASEILCEKNIDFICQVADNLTGAALASISQAAGKKHVPLLTFVTTPAQKGISVAAVARDYTQAGRDAAQLALRIVRGENPASIPFTYVSKTRIIINKTAADRAGLAIPEKVLKRADEVITK